MKRLIPAVLLAALLSGCNTSSTGSTDEDPAEVAIGERLFLETRFAQFAAAQSDDVNQPLGVGDPVLQTLSVGNDDSRPGPFAGQSMNCRQCHLVDEGLSANGDGMRTYADFAQRSPIPSRADRGDLRRAAVRNAPALVNASLPRPHGVLFHFDGEFPSLEALVVGTLTGRNYGWLADEAPQAIAHIARVVREDNGSGVLAREFGGSYRRVLAGTDPALPAGLRLPAALRLDLSSASDADIVNTVAKLIAIYVRQLEFSRSMDGSFNGSPYDLFLQLNALPRQPGTGESRLDYARRLRSAVEALDTPQWVPAGTRSYRFHPGQRYVFGAEELAGLQLFLRESPGAAGASAGNCIACHAPPEFTDFGIHNTGTTQEEFDDIHGTGSFAALAIPALDQRSANPSLYLPATAEHPNYREVFRSIPGADDPVATDLGVWSVFANPEFAATQDTLRDLLCAESAGVACPDDAGLLDRSIARFKTPGLRDLGHSAPYMHTGRFPSLDSVIEFYIRQSEVARNGGLRNAAPELQSIALSADDVTPLTRFLQSLNEDYE